MKEERPGNRRSTLRDVANLAGVTPSTVSRLLNDKPLPVAVTEKTRQRVMEAARTLKYRPNRLARGLSASQTHVLGMSFPMSCPQGYSDHQEITWLNFGMLMSGIQNAVLARGYELHIMSRVEYESDDEAAPPPLSADFLDGLIYVAPNPRYEYYKELADQRTPIVMLGPNPLTEPAYCVCPDNRFEAHQIVKALLVKGHRRVGYLASAPSHPPLDVLHRVEGYRQAHEDVGVRLDPDLLRLEPVGSLRVSEVVARLLEARPTAILVGRPEYAMDVFHVLHKSGLASPADVEVLILGDDRSFEMLRPRISAARFSYVELGTAAATLLVDVVEGREQAPRQITVPWSLVERETCILGEAYEGPRSDPYAAARRIAEAYEEGLAAQQRRP